MIGFLFVQIVLNAALVLANPDIEGIYTFHAQLVPFLGALPFLFRQKTRRHFSKFLWSYCLVGFLALALDYILYSHVGLIQLATVFVPFLLFALFRFVQWNWKRIHEKESLTALALCSIGWGFYGFAFPPLPLGPGAFVFLVPWFIVLLKANLQMAIFASFWSGFLYNVINYYWIYNVMNVGPALLILIGLVLLISYFSVYNVIAAVLFVKAREIRIRKFPILLILFPLFYAGLEMTRSIGDFSFPWSHLGYALGNQLPLLQALSLIGVFSYTALIIASNLSVAAAFTARKKILFAVPFVFFGLLWAYGSRILSKPEASPFYVADPKEAPKIAIVQPNIHQTNKWSKAYYDSVVFKTWQIADDSIDWEKNDVDLVVFPETAIPDFLRLRNREKRWIHKRIQNSRTSIFIGALDYDKNGKKLWSKQYQPLKYKEMNSQEFDEDFYAYIVDSVFGMGEVERRNASDRWLLLRQERLPNGGYVSCMADTTTMRVNGENIIFWEWQEYKSASGELVEIHFLKKAINIPQYTGKIVRYQHWNPREGWKDYTDRETDGAYHAVAKGSAEETELKALQAYESRNQKWVHRYSLEDYESLYR